MWWWKIEKKLTTHLTHTNANHMHKFTYVYHCMCEHECGEFFKFKEKKSEK